MRESTNYPGDYTLCVSCDGKVEHYRIMYHASKLSIDEEVYFENLMQLVEVSRPAGARTQAALGRGHRRPGVLLLSRLTPRGSHGGGLYPHCGAWETGAEQ